MSKEIHQPSPAEYKGQLDRIEAHKDAQVMVRKLDLMIGRLVYNDYVNENLEEAAAKLAEIEVNLNLSQDEAQEWVNDYESH